MENSRQKQVFHVSAHVPDIVICPEFVLTIFRTLSSTNSGHHFFIGNKLPIILPIFMLLYIEILPPEIQNDQIFSNTKSSSPRDS
jgi:hypothetical protein